MAATRTGVRPYKNREAWQPHLLLAPALLFFAVFAIGPLIFTLYVSLSNWSITGAHSFVGLANYAEIFSSSTFRQTFGNTVIFAVVTVTLQYLLGLTMALMVYRTSRGQTFLRLSFLLPMMLAPVVVGIVWKMLFDPSYGPIPELLGNIGLGQIPWFSEKLPAMIAIIVADTWQWTPFMFLILFAALRSIPTAPLEAAVVDGASSYRVFRDHLIPMLIPASITAILLRSIEAFKLFDVVYMMTGGGPGVKTSTITLNAYFTGLRTGNLGTAAAMTMVLLVVVLAAAMIFVAILAKVRSRRGATGKLSVASAEVAAESAKEAINA
ncbi:carbohydrate ABC transporter permease [Georgenia sp. SYP-B2076]|uniref:carbohydrate ABC transporter permease n=1 Tax=Georgenia sp. SYP-B2076 TaxID=2495881 RepID=UPI0013DF84B0|nr:sugar ABC transporter permease [Georgenia sp. SYP-B2076]